jgi:hypothetical protein
VRGTGVRSLGRTNTGPPLAAGGMFMGLRCAGR